MRLHANLQKRLTDVRAEVAALREDLRVLDEQIAHQQAVADDAGTEAVVAGTSLADRERRAAEGDLRRTRRERDATRERIRALEAQQDALLERLFAEQGATP